MHNKGILVLRSFNLLQKEVIIPLILKDRSPSVSSIHNMVYSSRIPHAIFSWHIYTPICLHNYHLGKREYTTAIYPLQFQNDAILRQKNRAGLPAQLDAPSGDCPLFYLFVVTDLFEVHAE